MTAADVWDVESQCRTDGTRDLVGEMPWFQVPYPFQYGALKFRGYAIFPMMGGEF
jgi:xanthine/uracil permease